MNKQGKDTPDYPYNNPKLLLESYQRGEAESLTWAIREHIRLSVISNRAYGRDYFESPKSIAAKFGCSTQDVHDAVRRASNVIRLGKDGDERRPWIICIAKDKDGRDAIKKPIRANYKRTPHCKKSVRQNTTADANACPNGRRPCDDSPAQTAGVPAQTAGEVHPQNACPNGRASEYTPNPPEEKNLKTRPDGGDVPQVLTKEKEAVRDRTEPGTGTALTVANPKSMIGTSMVSIFRSDSDEHRTRQEAIWLGITAWGIPMTAYWIAPTSKNPEAEIRMSLAAHMDTAVRRGDVRGVFSTSLRWQDLVAPHGLPLLDWQVKFADMVDKVGAFKAYPNRPDDKANALAFVAGEVA